MKTVWLDSHARALIEHEAVTRRLYETGGALFGWEDDGELVVACASGPGLHARHALRTFEPDPATTAEAMRLAGDASERRYRYVGSWHTHPRSVPVPSALDTDTVAGLAAQEDLLLPRPLLLILSTTGCSRTVQPKELRAWVWDPSHSALRVVELLPVELPERYCPDHPLFVI